MEVRKKAQLHNPQALFNMIRILQEYLINKSRIFVFLLLPLDLTFSVALLVSYTERIISYRVVIQFLQYLKYDLSYVREISLMVLKKDYVSTELTEKIDEKEISGTIYRHIQKTIKFIWSFTILLILLPILPVLWLYDFLAPKVMVGFLYYVVLFITMPTIAKIFLFFIATFLVASTTVPLLCKIFVYIKYLFELKRRPFEEIQTEAEMFFMKLYNYRHSEIDENEEEDEEDVGGGLYYLFLKFIHSVKDKFIAFFSARLRRKEKVIPQPKEVLHKIDEIKDKIVTKVQERKQIDARKLLTPFIAFVFTFALATFLVFGNASGKGILGSLVLSVVSKKSALIIWTNYNGTLLGFFQVFIRKIGIMVNFLDPIAFLIDFILKYFFMFWHMFFPIYGEFVVHYYKFLLNGVGINLFKK